MIAAQIKTEGGAKVKANKIGIYKKWKERSHSKISLKGTSNAENSVGSAGLAGELWLAFLLMCSNFSSSSRFLL